MVSTTFFWVGPVSTSFVDPEMHVGRLWTFQSFGTLKAIPR